MNKQKGTGGGPKLNLTLSRKVDKGGHQHHYGNSDYVTNSNPGNNRTPNNNGTMMMRADQSPGYYKQLEIKARHQYNTSANSQYEHISRAPVITPINEDRIELACRSVRFGTFRTIPTGNIVITESVSREGSQNMEKYQMKINVRHVREIQASFSKNLNVLFFLVSTDCAQRIRTALGMPDRVEDLGPDQLYFDPFSDNICWKLMTILLNCPDHEHTKKRVDRFFKQTVEPARRTQAIRKTGVNTNIPPLMMFLTHSEANGILTQATPQEWVEGMNTVGGRRETIPIGTYVRSPIKQRKCGLTNNTPSCSTLPSTSGESYRIVPAVATPKTVRVMVQRDDNMKSGPIISRNTSLVAQSNPANQGTVSVSPQKQPSANIGVGSQRQKIGSNLNRSGTILRVGAGSVAFISAAPQLHKEQRANILVRANSTTNPNSCQSLYTVSDGHASQRISDAVSRNLPTAISKTGTLLGIATVANRLPKPKPNSPEFRTLVRPVTRKRPFTQEVVDLVEDTDSAQPTTSTAKQQLDATTTLSSTNTLTGYEVPYFEYPMEGRPEITVMRDDLNCLNDLEFLNDNIVDFYLKYIHDIKLAPQLQHRVHIFNSFFWKKLTGITDNSSGRVRGRTEGTPGGGTMDTSKMMRHQLVAKWTKKVDIFEKDFVIVPICHQSHWYLAIVCYPGKVSPLARASPTTFNGTVTQKDSSDSPDSASQSNQVSTKAVATETETKVETTPTTDDRVRDPPILHKPCIIVFDSLLVESGSRVRYQTVRILKDYLMAEWAKKRPGQPPLQFEKTQMAGSYPRVPQQPNHSDCGVYLLLYVEYFLLHTPPVLPIPPNSPLLLHNWIPPERLRGMRLELQQLTEKMHDLYAKTEKEVPIKSEDQDRKPEERNLDTETQTETSSQPSASLVENRCDEVASVSKISEKGADNLSSHSMEQTTQVERRVDSEVENDKNKGDEPQNDEKSPDETVESQAKEDLQPSSSDTELLSESHPNSTLSLETDTAKESTVSGSDFSLRLTDTEERSKDTSSQSQSPKGINSLSSEEL